MVVVCVCVGGCLSSFATLSLGGLGLEVVGLGRDPRAGERLSHDDGDGGMPGGRGVRKGTRLFFVCYVGVSDSCATTNPSSLVTGPTLQPN